MWPFDTPSPSSSSATPIPPSACPVDPSTRQAYSNLSPPVNTTQAQRRRINDDVILSDEREISSIPRWLPKSSSSSATPPSSPASPDACPARSANPMPILADLNGGENGTSTESHESNKPRNENWIYPSPNSFYTSLLRKDRTPEKESMPVVVPIHNAVNERVWEMVLEWERAALASSSAIPATGGVERSARIEDGRESRLVSFIGRPKDLSLRARFKGFLGYSAPFDRHDWIVDRPVPSASTNPSNEEELPSIRIRYIIDFYTGRLPSLLSPDAFSNLINEGQDEGKQGSEQVFRPNLSFYLDVRPAFDDLEGVRMRSSRAWNNTLRNIGLA